LLPQFFERFTIQRVSRKVQISELSEHLFCCSLGFALWYLHEVPANRLAEASRSLTANSKNPQCIFLSSLQGDAFRDQPGTNNRQRIRRLHSLYMIKPLQDLHVPAEISYSGSLVNERAGYIDSGAAPAFTVYNGVS
jgi:hypothetical protein